MKEMELPVRYSKTPPNVRRLVREEYVKRQGGLCQFCKEPLSGPPAQKVGGAAINKRLFPPNFFKWPVHLHHCHETDWTIGAVHSRCNAYLWQYMGE